MPNTIANILNEHSFLLILTNPRLVSQFHNPSNVVIGSQLHNPSFVNMEQPIFGSKWMLIKDSIRNKDYKQEWKSCYAKIANQNCNIAKNSTQ